LLFGGDFLVVKRSLFVWAGRIVEVQTITGKLFYVAQMVDHGFVSMHAHTIKLLFTSSLLRMDNPEALATLGKQDIG
jgi:hypothetical protein